MPKSNGIEFINNNQEGTAASPSASSRPSSTDSIAAYVMNKEEEPLFTKVVNDLNYPVLVQTVSKKVSISADPTISDLIHAESLDAAIPTGFALIHNDILNLASPKGKGSSMSVEEGDAPFKLSLSDIVKSVLNKKGGSGSIIASGTGMAAKAFAPAIANLGKVAGFITNPYVLGTVAAAAGVAMLVNYIKNSEQREAEDHMKHLMNEMTMAMTLEDLLANPEAIQARDDAFVEYLKSYYKSQTHNMQLESFATGLVDTAFGMVNSFFTNLFGLKEESPLDTLMASLIDNVTKKANADELAELPEIKEARDQGIAEYVKIYYKSQAASLIADTTGSSFATLASSFVTTLFTGLFGSKDEESNTLFQNKLDTLIQELDSSLSVNDLLADETVKQAQTAGISSYITSYYNAQANAMNSSDVGSAAADKVKGFVVGLFSRKNENENSDLEALLDISDLIGTPTINDARKAGVQNFIESYFNNISDKLSGATLSSDNIETLNSTFTKTMKSVLGDKNNLKIDNLFENISNKESEDLLSRGNGQILVNDVGSIKACLYSATEALLKVETYLESINNKASAPSSPTIIETPPRSPGLDLGFNQLM